MKRYLKKLWYKATRQKGWIIFTADRTYRVIGKQEPPRMEGETARVTYAPWA